MADTAYGPVRRDFILSLTDHANLHGRAYWIARAITLGVMVGTSFGYLVLHEITRLHPFLLATFFTSATIFNLLQIPLISIYGPYVVLLAILCLLAVGLTKPTLHDIRPWIPFDMMLGSVLISVLSRFLDPSSPASDMETDTEGGFEPDRYRGPEYHVGFGYQEDPSRQHTAEPYKPDASSHESHDTEETPPFFNINPEGSRTLQSNFADTHDDLVSRDDASASTAVHPSDTESRQKYQLHTLGEFNPWDGPSHGAELENAASLSSTQGQEIDVLFNIPRLRSEEDGCSSSSSSSSSSSIILDGRMKLPSDISSNAHRLLATSLLLPMRGPSQRRQEIAALGTIKYGTCDSDTSSMCATAASSCRE